jgi:hypothetical protein
MGKTNANPGQPRGTQKEPLELSIPQRGESTGGKASRLRGESTGGKASRLLFAV